MKKFILISDYKVDLNGIVQVKLFPEDLMIQDFLASNHELTNRSDIDGQIALLIEEMTPILFEKFKDLESIPQFIKDEFEL